MTVQEYIKTLPADRSVPFKKIRETIKNNLPKGFKECINYKMLGYVVPKSVYPDGYHCDPKLPLPFMNLANQKGFIGLYHMGIYAQPKLLDWFVKEYPRHCKYKLDMGKSCVRFKKMEDIPYDLIAELTQKMTPDDWIRLYEKNIKK